MLVKDAFRCSVVRVLELVQKIVQNLETVVHLNSVAGLSILVVFEVRPAWGGGLLEDTGFDGAYPLQVCNGL